MAGLSTEEEDLAEAVRPLGDLIAIGRPGERFRFQEAAHVLQRLVEGCGGGPHARILVIIRAGQGEGLLWECEQAFVALSANRLVMLVLNLKAADYVWFARVFVTRCGSRYRRFRGSPSANVVFDFRNNHRRQARLHRLFRRVACGVCTAAAEDRQLVPRFRAISQGAQTSCCNSDRPCPTDPPNSATRHALD